jgi:hypothetical protein
MKPTNRREIFLAALANGEVPVIEPVTREEVLLMKQCQREAQGGGSGGGNDSWMIAVAQNFDDFREYKIYEFDKNVNDFVPLSVTEFCNKAKTFGRYSNVGFCRGEYWLNNGKETLDIQKIAAGATMKVNEEEGNVYVTVEGFWASGSSSWPERWQLEASIFEGEEESTFYSTQLDAEFKSN